MSGGEGGGASTRDTDGWYGLEITLEFYIGFVVEIDCKTDCWGKHHKNIPNLLF